MCVDRVQHGVRHDGRPVVDEKGLPRSADAEEIPPQGFLSDGGGNTELGDVRPLYYQLGRVRPTDVQGARIGVEDCQSGSSLPDPGEAGRSYSEAEEGGPAAAPAASAFAGVECLSDQAKRSRVQLPAR